MQPVPIDNELLIKQFEFAQKTIELVLTLTTGVIGITLVVAKDFAVRGGRRVLLWSWVSLLTSAVFGVLALGALTGELGETHPSIWGTPAAFELTQWVSFLGGLVLAVVYKARVANQGTATFKARSSEKSD